MLMSSTGFTKADKARIYYETVGEGRAVVFVHAAIADSRMWQPQFDERPEGFQLVRLDLRGFGHTRLPKEGYTDCEDVLQVMDELDIDRATVVGCSMGAEVALDLAALAPYRLDGLVLLGADAPGFEASSDYSSPQWPKALEAFKAGDLKTVAELDAEMWVVGKDRSRDDVDPEVFDLVREMDLVALRNEARRDEYRTPVRLEALPHIDVPTLVVVGEHDLPRLVEAAKYLEEVIDGARSVVIEDAAHLASLEQPERFNTELDAFLKA